MDELENSLKFRLPFRKEVFPDPVGPQTEIFTTYFAGMLISPFLYLRLKDN